MHFQQTAAGEIAEPDRGRISHEKIDPKYNFKENTNLT